MRIRCLLGLHKGEWFTKDAIKVNDPKTGEFITTVYMVERICESCKRYQREFLEGFDP
jgi:NMD protein affecting ribosome stability and mRNA decay